MALYIGSDPVVRSSRASRRFIDRRIDEGYSSAHTPVLDRENIDVVVLVRWGKSQRGDVLKSYVM